ncbi:HDL316Cp [Eremothecium sinecaudum]|uniref:ER lumen protein-retaining receptor n=1 Tax=Eremothecium sinecaudum TaxID=45286 RepID=A0A109UYR6_9SACH|nr:HDL316Cp [Eremothecium sinecaudum]AMD20428.1 HDL316Cp [Eremothecium sinecaudum]
MPNIFRLAGDASHLASIIILINTVTRTNSIDGISLKTLVLYSIVFITRYIDLFYKFHSLYNTLMKIVFIATSIYVVFIIKQSKRTNPIAYQNMIMRDSFKIRFILLFSAVMALCFHRKFTVQELLWSFSVWLESVAILPQLFMLTKAGRADTLTTHYIFALGLYRTMYIPNWIWRYYAEKRYDRLSIVTGVIQTLIYSDFFYIYYKKVLREGTGFTLPV